MFSIFKQQNKPYEREALCLYQLAMNKARLPRFYFDCQVPNTPDGRFEMITMHVSLIIDRLNDEHEETQELSQSLFDVMFADMDQSLRQIGLGDMTVPKRMRYLMKMFNARMHSYSEALKNNDRKALASIIEKNIFVNEPGDSKALADYMLEVKETLKTQSIGLLMSGQVMFEDGDE